MPAGSKKPLPGELAAKVSWEKAVMWPSFVVPMRMRWMVSDRRDVVWKTCGRLSASLTGRPAARAASADSTASGPMPSLEPKPPPI